jgi:hypothetical protein
MAAKRKKRVDVVKQREKRSKIAAIVGVVLLMAVGAYEIPSMLAVMNKKPPPGSTYDPGPSTGHGDALPNVAGGASGATNASGQLVNSDAPPPIEDGQLVSFSVFETKNPFTPQVSTAQAPPDNGQSSSTSTAGPQSTDASSGATSTTATTTVATPPTATTPGSVVPPTSTTPAVMAPTTTTTAAAPPAVAISVNGTVSHVGTNGTFPTGAPVFRLVSWTKQSAQIGIVGGSYATGDATLTLHVGVPVTLENQTDGKRYRIELLSTS